VGIEKKGRAYLAGGAKTRNDRNKQHSSNWGDSRRGSKKGVLKDGEKKRGVAKSFGKPEWGQLGKKGLISGAGIENRPK